ncbi:MAG: aldolase/citrate lyase family protein [Colwellia sp.]
MLITNDPSLARHAVESGVNRIFIDLEIMGKVERQGHLDTVISRHQMTDVAKIRSAIPGGELLVRLNPIHSNSRREVDEAIDGGADIIMLPMFHSAKEVRELSSMIDGRVRFMPLIETKGAAEACREITLIEGVTDLYIGLNDLHMDLGLKFMFEPVSNGLVGKMAEIIKAAAIPFGFGGIARISEGMLPAEKVLSQHVRLGSSCVILSRTFHRRSESLSELTNQMDLKDEIDKLLNEHDRLLNCGQDELDVDFDFFKLKVQEIVGISNK